MKVGRQAGRKVETIEGKQEYRNDTRKVEMRERKQ